jgi:hypothetical protein
MWKIRPHGGARFRLHVHGVNWSRKIESPCYIRHYDKPHLLPRRAALYIACGQAGRTRDPAHLGVTFATINGIANIWLTRAPL